MTKTLLVDNYDSFTFNLYHLIADVNHCPPVVIRNDDPGWDISMLDGFDNVVISPGPGRPEKAADFGICREILEKGNLPVFGICLGHQGICHVHGGEVGLACEAQHGRLSRIVHNGDALFAGIPSPFQVVRYHSLAVHTIADCLQSTAFAEDGTIMAVRHKSLPQWGVQFHPESICTEHGKTLFENFRKLSDDWNRLHHRVPCHKTGQTVSGSRPGSPHKKSAEELLLLHRTIARCPDSEALFDRLFRDSRHAVWLDSSRLSYGSGRFSFMCRADGPMGRILKADVASNTLEIAASDGSCQKVDSSFFDWLSADLEACHITSKLPDIEFALGWIGYIGYEMKAECGASKAHRSPYPDAFLLFADRGLVIDHQESKIHLLSLAGKTSVQQANEWLDRAEKLAQSLTGQDKTRLPEHLELTSPISLRHNRKAYIDLIGKSKECIRQGETYEVCLTNMAHATTDADPWTAWRMLRRANPTPYGAFLKLDDISILSCSPERFLKISRAGIAESKPIKGTRKRSTNPEKDMALREELASSEKETAENLMIVDLVRHDLGQTAKLGSVAVPELFAIESYQTVHQMVSTITSKLRDDASSCQCIRDSFPGGSMTGAPKRRTMQIIDALEDGPRGIYSGVIGYFSLCGAVDLSIVIRTLVLCGNTLSFGVGGAITALSDPLEEYDETRTKAKAFLDLFATDFPPD